MLVARPIGLLNRCQYLNFQGWVARKDRRLRIEGVAQINNMLSHNNDVSYENDARR